MKKLFSSVLCMLLLSAMMLSGCAVSPVLDQDTDAVKVDEGKETADAAKVDEGKGTADAGGMAIQLDTPYITVDDNVPGFSRDEITEGSFEEYSELDSLGRCGVALACVGTDLMPTEKRGNISRVKPTGWHSDRYDSVEGKNLYNRSHLIGYQLSGENANEKNLITGTRYMNVGMIPFEEMVADYVKETGNHVMYRVTPVFEGDNLVASGVQMEALSVEDGGEGVSYNVYLYNIQPGIEIDYATGESKEKTGMAIPAETGETYVLNSNTMKFHLPSCSSVEKMQEENRVNFLGEREQLIKDGYEPCGNCNP